MRRLLAAAAIVAACLAVTVPALASGGSNDPTFGPLITDAFSYADYGSSIVVKTGHQPISDLEGAWIGQPSVPAYPYQLWAAEIPANSSVTVTSPAGSGGYDINVNAIVKVPVEWMQDGTLHHGRVRVEFVPQSS